MTLSTRFSPVVFVAALVVGGCSSPAEPKPPATTTNGQASAIPAGLMLPSEPVGARNVLELKRDAKEGDSVVVRGRIAGGKEPFVDGRAIFTLGDFSLPTCADRPGDTCPTPWDYCCEPKEKITEHTATIQVVDAEGRPLKSGLKDYRGLKNMALVVVAGRVAKKQGSDLLVIAATGIFVQPAAKP
ncbi:MAG: hypothetical protein CHACPFDD_00003 [Phycisphaerae bacterium]|nr:hypothetical protein [Phycisphaerae bacterium]